jgi:queuine tRNA-ribosyltransferase subunit QTRTD1
LTIDVYQDLLDNISMDQDFPLQIFSHDLSPIKDFIGEEGIRNFAQLQDYPIFMGLAQKGRLAKDNGEKFASFKTNSGTGNIYQEDYANLIMKTKPDVLVPLFDMPAGTSVVGAKRTKKSIERSLRFLDDSLRSCNLDQNDLGQCPVFGVIISFADNFEETERLISSTQERNVSGFFITYNEEEKVSDLEVCGRMEEIVQKLDSSKPRMISSLNGSPEFIVEMWKRGIDLFESSCLEDRTAAYEAINFEYRINPCSSALKMDDEVYGLDGKPLVEGCSCYACRNHTRAYIHRLVQTNEMLRLVLIQMQV